jgi:16S rRNA (guanine527-N7)-methyltransferase
MARALKPLGSEWPFREATAPFDYTLADDVVRALATWLDVLVTWNARMDLTAARSEDELVDLMIVDAVVMATRVPHEARVVDVGSGAGAPGLALALLRPDLAVTLVEPLTKRISFLRTALAATGRHDVELVRSKGEDCVGRCWDVAVARATLAPPAWLPLGAQLVASGGSVWVLLAKEPAPNAANAVVVENVTYAWPRGGAQRRAVRYVIG